MTRPRSGLILGLLALLACAQPISAQPPSYYLRCSDSPYNAKFDGHTDDTAALQACLDAAWNASPNDLGVKVLLPAATALTGPLKMRGVPIEGVSGYSVLKSKPGQDILVVADVGDPYFNGGFPESWSVKGVTFLLDNSASFTGPSRPLGPGSAVMVGQAGIAMPVANGASPITVMPTPKFEDLRFETTTGTEANGVAAVYAQRQMYGANLKSIKVKSDFAFGIVQVPPTSNYASVEFAPDFWTLADYENHGSYGLVVYNGKGWFVENAMFYPQEVTDTGPRILGYQSLNRSGAEFFNVVGWYLEQNSAITGELTRVEGDRHQWIGGSMQAGRGSSYVTWAADWSDIHGMLLEGSGNFNVSGSNNRFDRLHVQGIGQPTIVDTGTGNSYVIGRTDH